MNFERKNNRFFLIDMGCFSSSPRIKALKEEFSLDKAMEDESYFIYKSNRSPGLAFSFLTFGVHNFSCLSGIVPSVCLSEKAFPVLISRLPFPNTTDIYLPVLSAAFYKTGRIVVLPHIGLFSQIAPDIPDDIYILVSRVMAWAGRNNSSKFPVLLLNFPDNYLSATLIVLEKMGFLVETDSTINPFDYYQVIIAPSTLDITSNESIMLLDFVSSGKGLVFAFAPHNSAQPLSFPINPLLSKFGLAYTFCSISETDNLEGKPVETEFSIVKQSHINSLVQSLKTLLADPNSFETYELEDIVTSIRYHLIVADDSMLDLIYSTYDICWKSLVSTNVIENQMFCTKPFHSIILVLLQDLISKSKPDFFFPLPGHEIFPGSVGSLVQLISTTLEFTISDESWIGTGLYLPPGVVGTVITDQPYPKLHIQIGSHHESLISKPGPWYRWPTIIQAYALDSSNTIVGTPFGGIIYIAASLPLEKPITLSLTFNSFAVHPKCVLSDPSIYESTKNNPLPFSELQTSHVIFTMPSKNLIELESRFQQISDIFDKTAEIISDFMSYPIEHEFRVVFDIDLPEDSPICGYPIVFPLSELDELFNNLERPSHNLYLLVNLLALSTLRENCFDPIVEFALSEVAASVVFSSLYNGFNPKNFQSSNKHPLFEAFWQIQTEFGKNIISRTIAKFQDPSYQIVGVPEDIWLEFVAEMCQIGEMDFTPLLEHARPIPLNVSVSLHHLPVFKTVDSLPAFDPEERNSNVPDSIIAQDS